MPDASKDGGSLQLGSELLCPFRLATDEDIICQRYWKADWPAFDGRTLRRPDRFDSVDHEAWRDEGKSSVVPLDFPESTRLSCGACIQTWHQALGRVLGPLGGGDLFRFRLDQYLAGRSIDALLHLPECDEGAQRRGRSCARSDGSVATRGLCAFRRERSDQRAVCCRRERSDQRAVCCRRERSDQRAVCCRRERSDQGPERFLEFFYRSFLIDSSIL